MQKKKLKSGLIVKRKEKDIMKYKIYCNGELIASFKHKMDRDFCFWMLRDQYPYCNFS